MTDPAVGARRRRVLGVVLAALGVGGVAFLVHHAGAAAVARAVVGAAPLLPVLLLLEGGRIACEAWGTGLLYAAHAAAGEPSSAAPMRRPPATELLRVCLAVYPAVLLVPAGRAVGEWIKAVVLHRHIGMPRALAVATAGQALPLAGGFLVSLPCLGVVAWRWGGSALTWAVAIQAASALVLSLAVQIGSRRRVVGAVARRWSERAGAAGESYVAATRSLPLVPPGPLAAAVASRLLQLCQLGVLVAVASGEVSLVGALLGEAIWLVGAAAGDMVPGQIGATDGAFAFAAPDLGLAAADAVAIALVMHVTQLTWAVVGGVVALGTKKVTGPPVA